MPFAVLLFSLFVTHELWRDAHDSAVQAQQTNFDFRARESNHRLEERMQAYEQVLRGVAGLYAASKEVSREEFHDYIESLRLEENYPGIQGLGFSLLISPQNLARHTAQVRAEGYGDYEITPPGERDVYSAIVYIEPFSGRNLRAFGFDMYAEPVRRKAMERARDTGKAAISGKVMLVQETGEDVQPGFLMYLPIYRTGTNPQTVEQRRAALIGWVFSPFRINDLMFKLNEMRASDIDIELYDGETTSPESALYDAHPDAKDDRAAMQLRNRTTLELAGHKWTAVTTALPAFQKQFDFDRSELVKRGGVSISLLLTLIIWLFLDDRANAIRSARQALKLALYDVLTGLPNRKLITERIGQALAAARREKRRVALMFMDLDKFKPINDDYGHAMGDLLLKEVATRLQECMREMDTAARMGGDEFLVLLPNIDGPSGAEIVANKVLQAMNQPFDIAGHTFTISASIGVAFYPDDADDEKALVRHADTAMYHAKNSGRNGVVLYRPGMKNNGH